MPAIPKRSRTFRSIVKEQEEEQRRQRSASAYSGTGMSPDGLGGTVTDGPLQVNGALTINGPAAITGTVSLPAGIINNDALAQPVVPGVHKANSSGFSIGLSWSEAVGGDVTVPAGCTQLLATSSVWVYAINPNTTGGSNGTGGDTLWCYVDIGGSSGEVYGLGLSGSNGYTTATSGFSVLKTGLTPGATLRIKGMTSSAYASLGSNAYNTATISTTLIWLR